MPGRSPRDKTWTHAERDSTRFQRYRTVPKGRLDNPTIEEAREAIYEQWCWWCGRDGFKSLASHTSKVHGIDRHELRVLANLFESVSIADPGYADFCRRRQEGRPVPIPPKGYKKVLNPAAKAANVARLRPFMTQEQRLAANRAAVEVLRKPRPCSVCGIIMPTSKRATCSTACRIEAHRRNQAHTTAVVTREQRSIAGRVTGERTRKSHSCRVCGTLIPKSVPVLCSRACRSIDQAVRNRVMNAARAARQ